jgi:UDP-2,4-diacetamido-2,4,6-trideoxy-beta-L-altropyranose hydrolase
VNVAFRVDASPKIGMGHLMRCLALSEELTRRGNSCFFISKTEDKNLVGMIKKFHVTYQHIKTTASLNEDLAALLNFSKDHDIDWVITDHYGIDAAYVKQIRQQEFNVLSIDDTAQLHYHSDIVVNQNIDAELLKFSVESYTELLLGPKYVMLRDELLKRDKKEIHPCIKKILITMGSTDSNNLILKILNSLVSISHDVEYLVILGPFTRFSSDLNTYIKKTDATISVIQSPKNMAEVYREVDLAVSAGGSSCYELAYYGITPIIITIAENQVHLSRELDAQHIGIYLGHKNNVSLEKLKEKVKELLEHHSLWQRMNQNGKNLVDGNGKKRIVNCMEKFQ